MSYSSSRTVSAWIGTDTTLLLLAVEMSAVQVNPGRISGAAESRVIVTLKLVAVRGPVPVGAWPVAGWIGLLPISVTRPEKVLPSMASMVTVAFWPISTSGTSVSSTSTSASITDMSATVSSTVPALFIVPTTTFSPSSMLRRVTMPSKGETKRACERL